MNARVHCDRSTGAIRHAYEKCEQRGSFLRPIHWIERRFASSSIKFDATSPAIGQQGIDQRFPAASRHSRCHVAEPRQTRQRTYPTLHFADIHLLDEQTASCQRLDITCCQQFTEDPTCRTIATNTEGWHDFTTSISPTPHGYRFHKRVRLAMHLRFPDYSRRCIARRTAGKSTMRSLEDEQGKLRWDLLHRFLYLRTPQNACQALLKKAAVKIACTHGFVI